MTAATSRERLVALRRGPSRASVARRARARSARGSSKRGGHGGGGSRSSASSSSTGFVLIERATPATPARRARRRARTCRRGRRAPRRESAPAPCRAASRPARAPRPLCTSPLVVLHRRRPAERACRPRQPEVEHLDQARLGDHQVRRLDVAVDEAARMAPRRAPRRPGARCRATDRATARRPRSGRPACGRRPAPWR